MTDPRWLILARRDIGLAEIPGVKNNPVIVSRLSGITKLLGAAYNDERTPWCAAMMTWWLKQSGLPTPLIGIRALSYKNYGSRLRPERVAPGAIMGKTRAGGGHVTLYIGESKARDPIHTQLPQFVYGLGANQGDSVNVSRFPIAVFLEENGGFIRWPKDEPVTGMPTPIDLANVQTNVKEV